MQPTACNKEAKELLISLVTTKRTQMPFDMAIMAKYCQIHRIDHKNQGNGIVVNGKLYQSLTPECAEYYGFNHRTPLIPIKDRRGRYEFLAEANRVVNTPEGAQFLYSPDELIEAINEMCAD